MTLCSGVAEVVVAMTFFWLVRENDFFATSKGNFCCQGYFEILAKTRTANRKDKNIAVYFFSNHFFHTSADILLLQNKFSEPFFLVWMTNCVCDKRGEAELHFSNKKHLSSQLRGRTISQLAHSMKSHMKIASDKS